jgi:hypothetical protein
MRKTLNLLILSCFLSSIIIFPLYASDEPTKNAVKKPEIRIDKILFAPSSLLTASEDDLSVTAYLRTLTKEGKFPNDFQNTVENSERIISFRYMQWGATLGWSGEENDSLSEPRILSVDYKIPLDYRKSDFAFALDIKYSTEKLPKSTLRRSLLDFGVFSITGLFDREISWIFDFYGGLTANYIYIDMASDVLTDTWKLVPFLGIRINVSPYSTIQLISEVNRAQDDYSSDPMWKWNFGVSLGF